VSAVPQRLGVVGAGTMGSGIAQLGCLAGMETFLHDPVPEALERGAEALRSGLDKGAERGRWSREDADAAGARLRPAPALEDLAPCGLVIEAAPERVELKRELFERLSEACAEDAILATNTSSILVSSLAGAAARPENVVGMHFFNPAPLMRLVELIAAIQTGERALAVARAAGEAMGKRVIVARDGPGFIVNRCGRPFYTEALRLLQERVATHEQIDRVCRLGGGFRMGPFELMDMVGIDVGFEVAKSFDAQSFGEPRWKPNPIQARMAASGRHGRKTGRGYYSYEDGAHRPDDPAAPEPGGGRGRAATIGGDSRLAGELRERARSAGFEVGDSGGGALKLSLEGSDVALSCHASSLAQSGASRVCGFHVLPPLGEGGLVELTRGAASDPAACEAAEAFFGALGFHTEWVGDAPGLVLGRIVCQLVNEAAFAIGEDVGSAEDVDAGLTLGLNHPRGPVAWGHAIGLEQVLVTIDALWQERREERYRAAPLLRRAVAVGSGLA
jgi:3-hydroxybutyryl-CoA dehydrogenase